MNSNDRPSSTEQCRRPDRSSSGAAQRPTDSISRRKLLYASGALAATAGCVGQGIGPGVGDPPSADPPRENPSEDDSMEPNDRTDMQPLNNRLVLDWVDQALETSRRGLVIPTSGRVYAFLGTVLYDAVNGIHQQRGAAFDSGDQYAIESTVDPGACRVAALAGGANEILTRLAESELDEDTATELKQAYDDLLETHLAEQQDGDQATGEAWGRQVAELMLEGVRSDAVPNCESQFDIAPNKQADLRPGMAQRTDEWGSACLADLEPWGLESPDSIVAPEPPSLDSLEFAVEYNRTLVVGDLSRAVGEIQATEIEFDIDDDRYDEAEARRLAAGTYVDGAIENEELGYADDLEYDEDERTLRLDIDPPDGFRDEGKFWAALPGTPQPEGRWLQVAKAAVDTEDPSFYETVRLYARLGIGVQDAGIANWNNKRRYADQMGWRPHAATGTDEQVPDSVADLDLPDVSDLDNPDLETKDDWRAISGWSPAPEYASGLTTVSTTSQRLLEDEFGDVGPLEVTVETADGETITEQYDGFEAARDQAAKSRVWSGRHYAPAMLAAIDMADQIVDEVVDTIG